jgi:hypothetical protein
VATIAGTFMNGPVLGVGGWVERWLLEHLGEHFGKKGLVWLLTQRYVLMDIDFPIWGWIVIAIAAILVVVSAVGLVKILLGERALGGEHIWAGVFWLLIIVMALYALR